MEWLTSSRSCRQKAATNCCAVCVVFSREANASQRVKLVLSDAFIAAYRLQSGDRLQVGFGQGSGLMLRRHPDGNRITGKGFSKRRSTTTSHGSCTTQPYVAFESVTYPAVLAWAEQFPNGTWVEVFDHGSYWDTKAPMP
jgi:hypothetical protein